MFKYIWIIIYIYVCTHMMWALTTGAMSEMCHRGCRCHRRAALHWGGGRPMLQNRRSLGCIKVLWYLGYFQWNSIIQDIKMIPNSNSLWSYNFNHSTLLSFSSWSNPTWKRVKMFQPIQRDVNCFAWGRSPIGQLCFLSLLFCGAQILTIPRDKSWFFIAWKATQNLQTDVRKLVFSLIIYIYII